MTTGRLTPKQAAFLQYIRSHIAEKGDWPTYEEIRRHFGYASPNSVSQNLQALEKKGHLEKIGLGEYRLTNRRNAEEMLREEVNRLREDYARLAEWADEACDLIVKGVDLMTIEQLQQWEGCRAVVETCPSSLQETEA